MQKAFPDLDFDETMAVADEDWYAQAKLTAPLTASGAAPPRSAALAHRPAHLDSSSGCKPRGGAGWISSPAGLAPGAARWVALLDTSGRLN
jgi:hypothetical protein